MEERNKQRIAELVEEEWRLQQSIKGLKEQPVNAIQHINERNVEINADLKQLKARIKELKLSAEEEDSEAERKKLLHAVDCHNKELAELRLLLRKANLACKQAMEKRHVREREALLQGGEDLLRQRKARAKRDVLKAHSNITSSLRRTRQLMAQELARSSATIATLEEQSDMLNKTTQHHRMYRGVVRVAHGLLVKMKRRECTDTLLIAFGVIFFLSVVCYIFLDRAGFLFH
ncbi:Vesicle transport protein S20, variant 2 [Balamuthia mandrillaris]